MYLCIGSLNIDYTYDVEYFVRPGECILAHDLRTGCGGKALNQSVALKKAGAEIYIGGKIGPDGEILRNHLNKIGVNTSRLISGEIQTGHTIIQLDKNSENSMIVYGGANQSYSKDDIKKILDGFGNNDILIIQNETNLVKYIIDMAIERKIKIVFNPAPMNQDVRNYQINHIDYLVLNETEAEGLSGIENHDKSIHHLKNKYPDTTIIITLGEKGVIFTDKNEVCKQNAFRTNAIDTVAAGDTFIGYLTYFIGSGYSIKEAIRIGCRAAAICVSRKGASEAIPTIEEVKSIELDEKEI